MPSQVNSKVLTGDIADQTSWIKKVLAKVNASMLSIMAVAFRSVYSSTTGLIVTPTAQQDGVVYKYTLAKCEQWLSRTQTSAISEHANKTRHYPLWDEVKFID